LCLEQQNALLDRTMNVDRSGFHKNFDDYIAYATAFSLTHPLLYHVIYKWIIFWGLTRKERKLAMEITDRDVGFRNWGTDCFALRFPILFLFVLVFKTGIKVLTAPCKIFYAVKR
jgi:hypothetical protein